MKALEEENPIIRALDNAGLTQADIAREVSVSTSTVWLVVQKGVRSTKIEKIITSRTGYKFPPLKKAGRKPKRYYLAEVN